MPEDNRIFYGPNFRTDFKCRKRINAIINLQQPGEHASCGDGLAKEGGFSYLPEEFMDHGSK